jgi:hypothetical protein
MVAFIVEENQKENSHLFSILWRNTSLPKNPHLRRLVGIEIHRLWLAIVMLDLS